jgi:hypothetical protein
MPSIAMTKVGGREPEAVLLSDSDSPPPSPVKVCISFIFVCFCKINFNHGWAFRSVPNAKHKRFTPDLFFINKKSSSS